MGKHVIYGAPGTGKTTFLLKIVEKYLDKGIPPERIAFCSFSKAASSEAKTRAISKFGFEKSDIPYFGTIHSMCYRHFFLGKKLAKKAEFFKQVNIEYKEVEENENFLADYEGYKEAGDIIMDFYYKLRLKFCKNIYEIKEKELKNYFYELPISEDNYMELFVGTFNLHNILLKYEEWKKENDVIDFIDMLLAAYKNKWVIPTDILIIDEFQDLSPLQYEIYKIWSKDKEEIYIAGDDDQTIYNFLCADSGFLIKERENLIKEEGDEEIILDKTYRLREKIHKFVSNYIRRNIKGQRIDKKVIAMKKGGEIISLYLDGNLEELLEYIRKDKSTFILFRTNYYKNFFIENILIPSGIIYDVIRGNGVWNKRTINIFNACIHLYNKEKLSWEEVKYLIENIPYKFGLMKRGLKTQFKDMKRDTNYSLSDLLKIGFNITLFRYINNFNKLYSLLKISDKIKESFIKTRKEIINYPILLKVGTIHSAKGKEADDVFLFKDVSYKIVKSINNNKIWDSEIRVFFVGMSRAKERLIILKGGFKNANTDIIP